MLACLIFFQGIWTTAYNIVLQQIDVKAALAFKHMLWKDEGFCCQQLSCICTYSRKCKGNSQFVWIFNDDRLPVDIEALHLLVMRIVCKYNIFCGQRLTVAPFQTFFEFEGVNQTIFRGLHAVSQDIVNAAIGVKSAHWSIQHIAGHQAITVLSSQRVKRIACIAGNRDRKSIGYICTSCFFGSSGGCAGTFCGSLRLRKFLRVDASATGHHRNGHHAAQQNTEQFLFHK